METNIFKILKLAKKENIHSAFISSIINSSDYAKEEFIKKLIKVSGKDFEPNNIKAQTEKSLSTNGAGRVDIYLTDFKDKDNEGNTRIIIENKIYAGDQYQQLERYHKHLEKYVNTALFYLTIEGKDAASYSCKGLNRNEDYYLLNYTEHIKTWLESVLENLKSVLENLKNNKSKTDTIIMEIKEKSNLKSYVQDYLEVIEELSKYNSLLDSDFKPKDGLDKNEFNALLEFRFWQAIEAKIYAEYEENYLIDNLHRYYSYSKILKSHKRKGKMPNDYGIILERKEKNDLPDFRLCISPSTKNVSLKFGRFERNGWVDDDAAQKKNIDNFFDLSILKSTKEFNDLISMVVLKLSKLI